MTNFKFIPSEFVVRNICSDRAIRILNTMSLNPGEKYDLLKIAGITEATILDALRKPNGTLFRDIERSYLRIESYSLITLGNSSVGLDNLVVEGAGGEEKLLGQRAGRLAWLDKPIIKPEVDFVANFENKFECESPLNKKGDVLTIGKAGIDSNGYLSKEDWLLFKGKANGWRVWRYQDFLNFDGLGMKITSFGDIGFNPDYIVNGSAVITDLVGRIPSIGKLGKILTKNRVMVQSHVRDSVALNILPKVGDYRVYFLVSIPDGMSLPENVLVPPYVRRSRIELLNSTDIDSGNKKIISGEKSFVGDVGFSGDVEIIGGGGLVVSESVSAKKLVIAGGASSHYSMVSNSVGEGEWSMSPFVESGPPKSPYSGQLWVKQPEYELYVYSDGAWLSVNTIQVSGGRNSPSVTDSYMKTNDNLSMQNSSFVLPVDCVLTAMSASSDSVISWSAEVHVGSRWRTGCRLNVNNSTSAYNDNIGVEFAAGESVQLFCSGSGVGMPLITTWFRKRY